MTICMDVATMLTMNARMAHTLSESDLMKYVPILPDNERLPKRRLLLERVLPVQRPKLLQNKQLTVERAGLVMPLDKLPQRVLRRSLLLLVIMPRVGSCQLTMILVNALAVMPRVGSRLLPLVFLPRVGIRRWLNS